MLTDALEDVILYKSGQNTRKVWPNVSLNKIKIFTNPYMKQLEPPSIAGRSIN
jgi:hypothetical protein